MIRYCSALALIVLAACGSPEAEAPESATIQPRLAFTIGADVGLTAVRDLTVDGYGNVFVFDYDDYVIHKFDPAGVALAAFGGPGWYHCLRRGPAMSQAGPGSSNQLRLPV